MWWGRFRASVSFGLVDCGYWSACFDCWLVAMTDSWEVWGCSDVFVGLSHAWDHHEISHVRVLIWICHSYFGCFLWSVWHGSWFARLWPHFGLWIVRWIEKWVDWSIVEWSLLAVLESRLGVRAWWPFILFHLVGSSSTPIPTTERAARCWPRNRIVIVPRRLNKSWSLWKLPLEDFTFPGDNLGKASSRMTLNSSLLL